MGRRKEKVDIIIGAVDKTAGKLKNIKNQIIGIGAAYAGWRVISEVTEAAVQEAAKLEASLISIGAVAESTGRDYNAMMTGMAEHTGTLASKSNVALGFLKGMTTTLEDMKISEMTQAIKDASIAMGEDFNVQLPLIWRGFKQLNPAVLDNIGVTVRLDQVNQRIARGYYGAGRELNEYTQQHALFQEIMRQTAKYAGQEEAYLESAKGRYEQLNVQLIDLAGSLGSFVTQSQATSGILNALSTAVRIANGLVTDFGGSADTAAEHTHDWAIALGEVTGGMVGLRKAAKDTDEEISIWKQPFFMWPLIKASEWLERTTESTQGFVTGLAEIADPLFAFLEAMGVVGDQGRENTVMFRDLNTEVKNNLDLVAQAQGYEDFSNMMQEQFAAGMQARRELEWQASMDTRTVLDADAQYEADLQRQSNEMSDQLNQENFENLLRYVQEYQDAAVDSTDDILAAFFRMYKEQEAAAKLSARQMEQSLGHFTGSVMKDVIDLSRGVDGVWKSMASHFATFFLNTILSSIGPGSSFASSFLGAFKFWDIAANDEALRREGRRARMFIEEGMSEPTGFIPNIGLGAASAGSPTSISVTNHFEIHGNPSDDDIDRIQEAIYRGTSQIAMEQTNLTGGRDAQFF